jgi:hypothetical protein
MHLRKFHDAGVEASEQKEKDAERKRIKRASMSLSQEAASRIHERDKEEAHRVRRASLDDEEEKKHPESARKAKKLINFVELQWI